MHESFSEHCSFPYKENSWKMIKNDFSIANHLQTLQDAKYSLLQAVVNTERGLSSSLEERSVIEEFMVCL